jgi:ApbE superfamily uncharacterized protein (UPF0280 family)
MFMVYQPRTYRNYLKTDGLVSFSVLIKETDLFITASHFAANESRAAVLNARFKIEQYIQWHPEFLSSLIPLPADECAPDIVQHMLHASAAAGVGPMASVAGAVAEYTARNLLQHCGEVIVENGGDIFLQVNREITISVFAGSSPLSNRIGIKISPVNSPLGVCTSSGTVGPSLSFGTADAVTIVSTSASLADAAATAVGNLVKKSSDIEKAIDAGKEIKDVAGILIIKDKQMGVWGNINLVSL